MGGLFGDANNGVGKAIGVGAMASVGVEVELGVGVGVTTGITVGIVVTANAIGVDGVVNPDDGAQPTGALESPGAEPPQPQRQRISTTAPAARSNSVRPESGVSKNISSPCVV